MAAGTGVGVPAVELCCFVACGDDARGNAGGGFFNSDKRELVLLAGAAVLASVGGGQLFTLENAWGVLRSWWGVYFGGGRHPVSDGS